MQRWLTRLADSFEQDAVECELVLQQNSESRQAGFRIIVRRGTFRRFLRFASSTPPIVDS